MLLTFHERMDDKEQTSRLTASDSKELEGIVDILHPIVTKKRKFMDLTRDREQRFRKSEKSGARRVREKTLVIREPQNAEVRDGQEASRTQSTGETSEEKRISRNSLVFLPEDIKVEKPAPPESWGDDDETPTQPIEFDEDLPLIEERASESVEYEKASDRKVPGREDVGVSPVEEYIRVVERIIKRGKLSPRSTEVLRKNVERYKSTLREAGRGIIESGETPTDTTLLRDVKTNIKRFIPNFLNIFSSESDDELPSERADSVIPLDTENNEAKKADPSIAEERSKKVKPASSSRDSGDEKSVESDRSAESVNDVLEEINKEKEKIEAENREVRSTVLTKFKESLKDSCNLESFTIEDPFSDFSLHDTKHDAVLKERIFQSQREDEEMIAVDDAEDTEPSTSKVKDEDRRKVHYEDDEEEVEGVFPDPLRNADDSPIDELSFSTRGSEADVSEKTYLDDTTHEPEKYRIDGLTKESLDAPDEMEIMEPADATLPLVSDTDDRTQMEIDSHAIKSQAGTSDVKDEKITDEKTIIADTLEGPTESKIASDISARDKPPASHRKKCAKCGMRVFVPDKETTEPRPATVEEKSKKQKGKSEQNKISAHKKSEVRCKCGCVGMVVENEGNSDEENPMTVMRCILNYFFPLATEYLVPRQILKIIFNASL